MAVGCRAACLDESLHCCIAQLPQANSIADKSSVMGLDPWLWLVPTQTCTGDGCRETPTSACCVLCSGRASTHACTPLPCQLATNSESWIDPGMERRAPLDRASSVVIIVSLLPSFTKALRLRLILILCPLLVVVSSCHRRGCPGGRASNQSRLHCVVWSVVFVCLCGSGGPSWRRPASPDFESPGTDLISPSAHSADVDSPSPYATQT